MGVPPRISIVIPNLNSGPVLERAIRSMVQQNYPNLQLIAADAGSHDESREILERHRRFFDPLLVRKDNGPPDGLNYGFGHANGDIFAWLGADDELLPGALDYVGGLFARSPLTDVLIGGCERVYADGSVQILLPPGDVWAILGVKNCIEQPSVFWRGALHRKLGGLDTSYDLAFDWDFWCRMKTSGARVLTTTRVLSRYRFSATNKTSRAGRKHVDEQFRIIRKYGKLRRVLPFLYRFLYLHFDLHGVYDNPPPCSRMRLRLFALTLGALRLLIGRRLVSLYNWRFASCQERNLKWW